VAALSVNDPGAEPPPGWAWTSLRRIARQETGHTPSRNHPEYWDGGVPWIGIRDAADHHGQIINETRQTISEDGLANSSARLLPEGTVCLSRTASVGYVTIMGRAMATSQDFATWSCTPAFRPKFLMYAIMAEGERIREFGEGSTHTTIYFPEIRALHICLAPLLEQDEIIRRVETAFTWIDRLASDATSARKLIGHLDQAVLAKAFHGELVPQDPNDEPASVVLERIRAAKPATVRAGRRAASHG
jgi:type I restriction enzyme S subunit